MGGESLWLISTKNIMVKWSKLDRVKIYKRDRMFLINLKKTTKLKRDQVWNTDQKIKQYWNFQFIKREDIVFILLVNNKMKQKHKQNYKWNQ